MNLTAAAARPLEKEKLMPADQVFDKFKEGKLHSGSKDGPVVKDHDQAVAIFMDEKRKANEGKAEYQSKKPAASHDESMGERMKRLGAKK